MATPVLTVGSRRSRFHRQSVGKSVCASPRDIEIFRLLARYRYLPSDFIQTFVGGNAIRLKQRLGDLYHEGFVDRPRQQWQTFNARYRPATYELGAKGREMLRSLGEETTNGSRPHGTFAHEYLVSVVGAAFELGTRSSEGTRFIASNDLDGHDDSGAVPVTISYGGRQLAVNLRPDGRPFAISRQVATARTRTLYFAGLEIDRHTEPLRATDLLRSSLLRKILAYREVVASGAHRTRWGFPNMMVPIVTVNPRHMEHICALILEVTAGKGASYLLLKTVPDFFDPSASLRPDAALYREPWQRAGFPPLDLEREVRGDP